MEDADSSTNKLPEPEIALEQVQGDEAYSGSLGGKRNQFESYKKYYLVGRVPVSFEKEKTGLVRILAFNHLSGQLEPRPDYWSDITRDRDGIVQEISEEQFILSLNNPDPDLSFGHRPEP